MSNQRTGKIYAGWDNLGDLTCPTCGEIVIGGGLLSHIITTHLIVSNTGNVSYKVNEDTKKGAFIWGEDLSINPDIIDVEFTDVSDMPALDSGEGNGET